MSNLDNKKLFLDELKTWRNYAMTSLIALIAFIFAKFGETNIWILVLSIFAVIGLGIVAFVLQRKILKIIDEIKEL